MKQRYILAEFRSPSASNLITVAPTYQAPTSSELISSLPSGCLDGHYVCWCSPYPVTAASPELQPLLLLLDRRKRS